MENVLNKMMAEILHYIDQSKNRQQRHKKTAIGRRGSEKLAQLSDATFTYFQTQFPSANRGSVAGKIMGNKGEDIALQCFSDRPRLDLMIEHLAARLSKKEVTEDDVAQWKDWLFYRKDDQDHPPQIRREFLKRVLLPMSLRPVLAKASDKQLDVILRAVMDQELRKTLYEIAEPADYDVVEQFLRTREATFGAPLTQELNLELQRHSETSGVLTDKEKCVLTVFHGLRRALGLADTEMYQSPTNLKELTIGKGVDRSNTELFPHYATLVQMERVQLCRRRAVALFTAGLAKVSKGLTIIGKRSSQTDIPAEATNWISAGWRTIFNVTDAQERPCKGENVSFCTDFTPFKESAASAILMMYMELMDFAFSPNPPLMLRKDMRVTALYQGLEPYQLETYETWPSDKKEAYREEYLKFCAKYMNVGFTFTEKRGVHGMQELNLDAWGEGELVVNPFRVKQDGLMYKLFGSFRPLPNRLGVGSVARQIMLAHRIRYNFDPTYCQAFIDHEPRRYENKNEAWFPRPIFDVNFDVFYEPPRGDIPPVASHLYHTVQTDTENGPREAGTLRKAIDQMSLKDWVAMDFDGLARFRRLPPGEERTDIIDRWRAALPKADDEKEQLSRAALAMMDIHRNWSRNFNSSFFASSQRSNAELVKPEYEDQWVGSEFQEEGFAIWKKAGWTLPRCCEYRFPGEAKSIQVSWTHILPPPALVSPLLHPVLHERVDPKHPDVVGGRVLPAETKQVFVYPMDSLQGKPLLNLFPVGERAAEDQPYEQRATSIYEIFPRAASGHQAWDLRISLVKLVPSRALNQVQKCMELLHSMRFTATVNITNLQELRTPSFPIFQKEPPDRKETNADCEGLQGCRIEEKKERGVVAYRRPLKTSADVEEAIENSEEIAWAPRRGYFYGSSGSCPFVALRLNESGSAEVTRTTKDKKRILLTSRQLSRDLPPFLRRMFPNVVAISDLEQIALKAFEGTTLYVPVQTDKLNFEVTTAELEALFALLLALTPQDCRDELQRLHATLTSTR